MLLLYNLVKDICILFAHNDILSEVVSDDPTP